MRKLYNIMILFLVLVTGACNSRTENSALVTHQKQIQNREVAYGDLILNQVKGIWYHQDAPYNGFSIKYYANGAVAERLGFYNGKRQGTGQRWSEQGVLRSEFEYEQNKLVGTYKSWWENGQLASKANYENGVLNGTQMEWYETGQLAKKRKLVAGNEKGLQQSWLPNGKIYVNYEARNGRNFGLKRANLCYQLKDEIVQK
ncbi:MAG: hypothetical protein WA951_04105 [Leeuwenhoekiella sp.]